MWSMHVQPDSRASVAVRASERSAWKRGRMGRKASSRGEYAGPPNQVERRSDGGCESSECLSICSCYRLFMAAALVRREEV